MDEKQVLLISEASLNQLLKAVEMANRAQVRSAFVLGAVVGGAAMAYLGYKVAYGWMVMYKEEKRKKEDAEKTA